MKKLEVAFTKGKGEHKVQFVQMNSTKHSAIYICVGNNPDNSSDIYYEIFKIKISPQSSFTNRWGVVVVYEESERYPKDEWFGISAWTTRSFEQAYEIYNELNVVDGR